MGRLWQRCDRIAAAGRHASAGHLRRLRIFSSAILPPRFLKPSRSKSDSGTFVPPLQSGSGFKHTSAMPSRCKSATSMINSGPLATNLIRPCPALRLCRKTINLSVVENAKAVRRALSGSINGADVLFGWVTAQKGHVSSAMARRLFRGLRRSGTDR
jgi:hypothetical protein